MFDGPLIPRPLYLSAPAWHQMARDSAPEIPHQGPVTLERMPTPASSADTWPSTSRLVHSPSVPNKRLSRISRLACQVASSVLHSSHDNDGRSHSHDLQRLLELPPLDDALGIAMTVPYPREHDFTLQGSATYLEYIDRICTRCSPTHAARADRQ